MRTIGIKELQKSLKEVQEAVGNGKEYIVTSRGKAVFKIVPFSYIPEDQKNESWQEALDYFKGIQFEGGDPDASKKIDELAWS